MKFSNNSGPPFGSTLNGSGTQQLTLPFHLRSGQGGPSGQCLFRCRTGNKEDCTLRNASILLLLLFTSFRRAREGDGSLRKLTNVAGSRNGYSPHTSTRLDAR